MAASFGYFVRIIVEDVSLPLPCFSLSLFIYLARFLATLLLGDRKPRRREKRNGRREREEGAKSAQAEDLDRALKL